MNKTITTSPTIHMIWFIPVSSLCQICALHFLARARANMDQPAPSRAALIEVSAPPRSGGHDGAWGGPMGPHRIAQREGSPMTQSSILGLVAFAIGTTLLVFAWRASQAPVEQVTEALTGRYSNSTMWFLLGGLAGVVTGAGLLWRGVTRG